MASRECSACHNLSDDDYCQGCLVETVPVEKDGAEREREACGDRGRRRVYGRESFSLPATIWLGSCVSLDIRMERG